MQDYAFTVKYNRKTDDIAKEYERLFKLWDKKKVNIKYKEMHTDKPIYHYHGLMEVSKRLFLKTLMVYGFHIKIEIVNSYKAWYRYCNKQHVNIMPNLFLDEPIEDNHPNTPVAPVADERLSH